MGGGILARGESDQEQEVLIWAFLQPTLSREGEDWQDKSANINTVEVLVFQQEIKTLKQEW